MKTKLMIFLLICLGSISCVTYKTDGKYEIGNEPIKIEYHIEKVYDNEVNCITIWRLDTPFKIRYVDIKAIESISGIFNSRRVPGLPYSMYFSTYKLSDIEEIDNMINHYIHYKAFKPIQSWVMNK